jgi:transporter family-2 protein
MMDWKPVLPLLLGTLVVFQPAINRHIMDSRGLGFAIIMNHSTLFVLAMVTLGAFLALGERVPDLVRPRFSGGIEWWFIIPGFISFTLTALVPIALGSVGAVATVVGMLAGQLATSMVWDFLAEGRPPTLARIAGMMLAMAGAVLSFKK